MRVLRALYQRLPSAIMHLKWDTRPPGAIQEFHCGTTRPQAPSGIMWDHAPQAPS